MGIPVRAESGLLRAARSVQFARSFAIFLSYSGGECYANGLGKR